MIAYNYLIWSVEPSAGVFFAFWIDEKIIFLNPISLQFFLSRAGSKVEYIDQQWTKDVESHTISPVNLKSWLQSCVLGLQFWQIVLQHSNCVSSQSVPSHFIHSLLRSLLFVYLACVWGCFTLQTPQIWILPQQIAAAAGLNEIKPFCAHVITPKSWNGCGSEFV